MVHCLSYSHISPLFGDPSCCLQNKNKNKIYGLLTKVSASEKSKYYKHFWQLHEHLKDQQNINHEDLNHLLGVMETNTKQMKTEQQSISEDEKPIEVKKQAKTGEASISGSRGIYFKILGTYSILLGGVCFYFLFNYYFTNSLMDSYWAFTRVFNEKMTSTLTFMECNY